MDRIPFFFFLRKKGKRKEKSSKVIYNLFNNEIKTLFKMNMEEEEVMKNG